MQLAAAGVQEMRATIEGLRTDLSTARTEREAATAAYHDADKEKAVLLADLGHLKRSKWFADGGTGRQRAPPFRCRRLLTADAT